MARKISVARTTKMEIARDLNPDAINEIATALPQLLADVFSLYVKTKNFHWHMRGPQFRDYHLLLDEHAEQIFTMTDDIAERQARSAPRRCIPSATSRGTSASRTMTTTRLAPGTC